MPEPGQSSSLLLAWSKSGAHGPCFPTLTQPCPTRALLATTSVPADLIIHYQQLSLLAGEFPLASFLLSTPQLIVDRSGCISIPPFPTKIEQLRRYTATQTPRVSEVERSAHQLQGRWLKSIFLTSVPSLYACLLMSPSF